MSSETLRLRGILRVAALAAWLCGSTIALGQEAAPEPNPNDTEQHTSNWSFFAARLVAEPLGQYSVDAGYHCGSLCAGAFHYTFRIVGKTCSITSKDMRWVS